MIHVTLFSADSVNFRVDLKPDNENSSLFVTAIDQSVEHEFRLFLTLDQLRTLRDLLNEKLPCDPVKLEHYVTIEPQTL